MPIARWSDLADQGLHEPPIERALTNARPIAAKLSFAKLGRKLEDLPQVAPAGNPQGPINDSERSGHGCLRSEAYRFSIA